MFQYKFNAFLFFIIVYLFSQSYSISAQICTPPSVLTKEDAWMQSATVNVNIDPSYNTQQRAAIAQAFSNWNFDYNSCSEVFFATPTYQSQPIAGPSINPSSYYDFKFQVYRVNPPSNPSDRGLAVGKARPNMYTIHAYVYINTNVTDPEALKQVMAHEIGHTFGLGECTNCGSTKSVMNDPVPSYNDTNGLSGPTY